ncbi:hypothetical protein ACQPXM_10750 [Kribbella sp. CA-253562]|uniref:hypothetical protein n=1 Tax=Kribbella sp. CA-253562 TaxID=3239942 RepID=UPI003D9077D4
MEQDGTPGDPAAGIAFVGDVVARRADGVDRTDLLAALQRIRSLRQQLTAWEPQLIDAARAVGVSWADLAPALGVASRQAAEKRYLRLNADAEAPAMTGEQRVQATRDQRAGDRAVVAWARDNAADLRRLAGQVSALDGLDRSTQASVDRVHDALGGSDSAALLEPLADAGPRLARDHPLLAERISAVEDRTNEVREAGARRTVG